MALDPTQFAKLRLQLQSRQGLPTPAPESETPNYLSRVSADIGERFAGAAQATETVPENPSFRDEARAGLSIADDITGAVLAPIAQAPGIKQIGELFGWGADKISDLAMKNPKYAAGFEKLAGFLDQNPEIGNAISTANNLLAIEGVSKSAGALRNKSSSLFTRPSTSVEEVIDQAQIGLAPEVPPPLPQGAPPAAIRAQAEATAPQLSVKEKWIGISPDIKKRITGKQDRLQEYFDVAHARNADDTVPTPYEYGAQQAQTAVESMENLLSESGGKIGATREKIGTYQASPAHVERIEQGFVKQLNKLNLEERNGIIRQKTGTISKAGNGDIKMLNDFYNDLKVIKQSPSLTNLIEFRSALDSKVNFAKSAREASTEIDPFARTVRKDIADVAADIVGKSEAGEVARFSDFMDAYNDLKSYTDRKAGGEYLLKLVLSGRGREARSIITTIKEYTGIDLMDDATMMTIATDVVGNPRQQNLFRQEVTKAGLDAARILSGDVKGGVAGTLSNLMSKHLLDQEKAYLEASR